MVLVPRQQVGIGEMNAGATQSHSARNRAQRVTKNESDKGSSARTIASGRPEDYCRIVEEGLDREATRRPHLLHYPDRRRSIEGRYSREALSVVDNG